MNIPTRDDNFGSVGRKLSLLLDKNSDSRVLLAGHIPKSFQSDFERYFKENCCRYVAESLETTNKNLRQRACFDFIICGINCGADLRILRRVSSLYGNATYFIVMVDMSITRQRLLSSPLKSIWSYCSFQWSRISPFSLGHLRNIHSFIPYPSFLNMEELVAPEKVAALLKGITVKSVLRNKLGTYLEYMRGRLFLISSCGNGIIPIVKVVEKGLGSNLLSGHKLSLVRFDMRARGALVMVLSNADIGRLYIARAVDSETVAKIVSLNGYWTNKIKSDKNISQYVKQYIPESYGSIAYNDGMIYFEDYIEGLIAWKLLKNNTVRNRMYADVYKFIFDLNQGTQNSHMIEKFYDEIMGNDLVDCYVELARHKYFLCNLKALDRKIRLLLPGVECKMVWGHGDYGFGNVLVDKQDGSLRAVIDWDTAREFEIIGVDLLNFLVQARRMEYGEECTQILEILGNDFVQNGFVTFYDKSEFDREFSLTAAHRLLILAFFILRRTLRAARYPTIFQQNILSYEKNIEWMLGYLNDYSSRLM